MCRMRQRGVNSETFSRRPRNRSDPHAWTIPLMASILKGSSAFVSTRIHACVRACRTCNMGAHDDVSFARGASPAGPRPAFDYRAQTSFDFQRPWGATWNFTDAPFFRTAATCTYARRRWRRARAEGSNTESNMSGMSRTPRLPTCPRNCHRRPLVCWVCQVCRSRSRLRITKPVGWLFRDHANSVDLSVVHSRRALWKKELPLFFAKR